MTETLSFGQVPTVSPITQEELGNAIQNRMTPLRATMTRKAFESSRGRNPESFPFFDDMDSRRGQIEYLKQEPTGWITPLHMATLTHECGEQAEARSTLRHFSAVSKGGDECATEIADRLGCLKL
jgi:hypothetical protein